LNDLKPKAPDLPTQEAQRESQVDPVPSNSIKHKNPLERRLLLGILMIALIHGLIYIYLMPPWQHYEEPAHFEYSWMIAEFFSGDRADFPGYGDYDQDMRREIAASMIENDFFREIDFLPDLESEEPVWIGLGQAGTAPAMHILMTIPLKLFAGSGVEVQLYAARTVSLALYLLTILFASGTVSELTRPGNILRLGVPLLMALHPGFVDLMTALNDDVGAVAVFSSFLWVSVRILQRGLNLPRFLALLVLTLLCFFTKVTVFLAIPLALLVLVLVPFRKSISPLLVLVPITLVLAGLILTLDWGDAALWYRQTDQESATRASLDAAPLGEHAFTLQSSSDSQAVVRQRIPEKRLESLRGKGVTLGAWIWASEAM